MSTSPTQVVIGPHRDRVGVDPWLLIAIGLAGAVLGGVAGGTVLDASGWTFFGRALGALLAVVVMFARPGWSLSTSSRAVLGLTGLALVRFGVMHGSLTSGGEVLLAWLVSAVVVIVVSEHLSVSSRPDAARPGGGSVHTMASAIPGASRLSPHLHDGRSRARSHLARSALAVVAVATMAALLVTPIVLPRLGGSSPAGEGPSLGSQEAGAAPLRSSEALDMTTRPKLTDEVVFTVEASRATFWRGETFDRWDGRTWSRGDPNLMAVLSDEIVLDPLDLGSTGDDVVEQKVRFQAPYAEVVYAAASAVSVDAGRPVAQRRDGTVLALSSPFGRGGGYTVVSRRHPLSEARLRSVGATTAPDEILDRYAAPPVATERVRAAAVAATRGAETTYDKILALEAWMGERTEYSLDAPLSPTGVDVVDHFLFESRQGWCEQIASSLVVLARANGIPARLVTGYVPGEVDRVTGRFVVRERDAHAWAEVWFPEVGWVPFDPTADVPLAGVDQADTSLGQWLIDHALIALLATAALVAVIGPTLVLIRRWRRRRALRPIGWAAQADAKLAALGKRHEWERSPAETATAYSSSLGRHLHDERVAVVGQAIDLATYGPEPPSQTARAEADAILADLTS